MKTLLFKTSISSLALLVVASVGLYAAGVRYNMSESLPPGFYRVDRGVLPQKGQLAMFCLEDTEQTRTARSRRYLKFGFCPGYTMPLVKRVFGVSGDVVSVDESVFINSEPVPNTNLMKMDAQGRALYPYQGGILTPGEYFLLSDYSPYSFDSRYFGPIEKSQLLGVVYALDF